MQSQLAAASYAGAHFPDEMNNLFGCSNAAAAASFVAFPSTNSATTIIRSQQDSQQQQQQQQTSLFTPYSQQQHLRPGGNVVENRTCNSVSSGQQQQQRQSISSSSTIKRSVRSGVDMIKCSFCPKKLPGQNALQLHLEDCRMIRVHECDLCGKRFKARGGLQQHNRIHVNDRPYMCQPTQQQQHSADSSNNTFGQIVMNGANSSAASDLHNSLSSEQLDFLYFDILMETRGKNQNRPEKFFL
uniref:C2H2-type domain-containing protein n=1 Tax=Meloidogyne javanica TaxID=6303 RepID=A0A915LFN6_MELJA